MIDFSENPPVLRTNYEQEQACFARIRADMDKKDRGGRWRWIPGLFKMLRLRIVRIRPSGGSDAAS